MKLISILVKWKKQKLEKKRTIIKVKDKRDWERDITSRSNVERNIIIV